MASGLVLQRFRSAWSEGWRMFLKSKAPTSSWMEVSQKVWEHTDMVTHTTLSLAWMTSSMFLASDGDILHTYNVLEGEAFVLWPRWWIVQFGLVLPRRGDHLHS